MKNPLVIYKIEKGLYIARNNSINKKKKNKNFNLKKKYIPLHTHSDLSLLDGASRVSDLVNECKRLNIPAISLTDHGVMHGIVDLFKECEKADMTPIVGNEMYVINGNISRNYRRGEMPKFHQIILATNAIGYKNVVKLTTLSHLSGWQGKGAFGRPCISKNLLAKYQSGTIITSSCLGGEISRNLLYRKKDEARKVSFFYKKYFKNSFYLEIQDHGHREDRVVNTEIVDISRLKKIKLIGTNDSHFTTKRDVETHDSLLCIQTGKPIEDIGRMRYSGTEFLKSSIEMFQMFRDHIPESFINSALTNSNSIFTGSEAYSIWEEIKIPAFKKPVGFEHYTNNDFFKIISFEGLVKRLNGRFSDAFDFQNYEKINIDFFENEPRIIKYYKRLDHEINSIIKMGFSTYFLVVWDFINFARKNLIPVGPGRGSVAGSLVAYSLGITNVDPIEHELLFERFLNPSRKSMPDIDTDFSINGRETVIEYVSMRYGQESVAQIITFNRLTSKAILKDTGKTERISPFFLDKMAESIPISRGKPVSLIEMIERATQSEDFRKKYLTHGDFKTTVDKAMQIEGMNKTTAVHAAGIVISSKKLDTNVPLARGFKGEVVTQYPMEDVEFLGLLKMDFLGLKNLSMVETTIDLINFRFNTNIIDLDADYLRPHFDHSSYEILAKGDLEGVFQLDASPGMKDIVAEMLPNSIQDISCILALYRPGPLDAGLIPKFVKRKREEFFFTYDFPELEFILGQTYGILLYQEQIMKLGQEIGGYSMDQADLMRRAMGKKKKKEMQIQKKNFIEGCLNNSFEKISSEKVFEQILGFAEYCFNKSHSTSYAFTTYQTAWLKSHWPVEFFSSLLSANLADIAKIEKYVFQAEFYGINILKPCINSSEVSFFPIENVQNHSHISFGLGSIKNVGEMGAIVILSQRKLKGAFVSMTDVVKRLMYDELLGNSLIEALIYSGSLDKFGLSDSRKIMFSDSKKINKWIYKKQKIILKSQPLLIDMKWMTERENTLFGLRRDFKKKDILHDENQVGFQSKFTGLSDFNFKILEQIDIKLLLGTFQFMNFHDQYFQRKSETNKNLVEYTEESLINQNFLKTEKFLFIGLILEVQIYQVNFSTILIKFILEDTNGIFIGLDFMNFELLDTDFFLKTKNKIIRNLQSKKCLPGEMIMGFGVIKEDDYRNKLSLLNYYNLKKSLILVLRIRPDQIGNKALQILIIKCIRDNGKLDERIPTVPVIINIRGYFRTENIRLKSPINRSNVFIICEKLKIIGLESMVFKV